MSAPVRVMIVDDSSVVRRLLTAALSAHPEITVAGSAANGVIALSKLAQINPDAVILDVEMPEMDGITTLTHLRESHPRLPVIMFSTLTERGAYVTFDALAAGASDYVLKPSSGGETLEGVVNNTLVPKLLALTRSRFGVALQAAMATATIDPNAFDGGKGTGAKRQPLLNSLKPTLNAAGPLAKPISGTLAPKATAALKRTVVAGASTFSALAHNQVSLVPHAPRPGANVSYAPAQSMPAAAAPQAPASVKVEAGTAAAAAPALLAQRAPAAQPLLRKPVQVIAIATSTGGPNALADVLSRLPGGLPVPIVVVQHMPPIFTRCLAERLDSRSELKVVESEGQEPLSPGHVYIAPGHRHLEVVRDCDGVRTQLSDAQPENSCRPAADVLLRSLVRAYGGAVLCVVLTGMGQDGLRGAREVYDAGGRVLAQSGPTCVIWGMPKAIEEAGIAEAVVPLPEMAAAILQRVGFGLLPVRGSEESR